MMSNEEIRKYVKENIKGQYGRILGFTIIVALMTLIASSVINLLLNPLLTSEFLEAVAGALVAALLTPLTVGLYKILIDIINKRDAKFDDLFAYFNNFKDLFILGIIGNLCIELSNLVLSLLSLLIELFYIGMLYLYIFNPNIKLKDSINVTFDKMKIKIWSLILLSLSYTWPVIVAILIAAVIPGSIITSLFTTGNISVAHASGSAVNIIFIAVLFLFAIIYMFFISPYSNMAHALFYMQVLGNQITPNQANTVTNMQNSTFTNLAPQTKFCPSCGNKVDGNFCTNCGNKLN